MLQGTGHPAEKPELTPASQLDPGPSHFLVVIKERVRLVMALFVPAINMKFTNRNTVNFFKISVLFTCFVQM